MIFAIIIGVILSIVLTVLLCVKVLPAKYDGTFGKKILQTLHDYFNFKKLYIESILKGIFTFLSVTCVAGGALVATVGNILQLVVRIFRGIANGYMGSWIFSQFFVNLIGGIAIAVLAPIVLRLVYEGFMMFILLVKNVIEINNKMKASKAETETKDEM